MYKNSIAIVLFLFPVLLLAQSRNVINLNESWQYFENFTEEVTRYSQNTTPKEIDLPHTWNQWDATDFTPGYRRSASWYVKDLPLEFDESKRYILYFEGANISTQVYVNNTLAGEHIGGYVGFEIELTQQLKKGKNKIAIRVDNSYNRDIIPSQKSDFFIYGGITRDLWLKIVPQDFIQSVKVKPTEISEKKANTSLVIQLDNASSNKILEAALFTPNGKQILQTSSVKAEGKELTLDFPSLKRPQLWSPDAPNLYTVKVYIKENGKIIDEIEERFGYRWFHFEAHGAFFLNGKKLKIRGTHRHEEHAGLGAAMPNALHRKDIELIKEMGGNFVRLGHYPQDPEVYRACDELGILVWDELPWCRGGIGEEVWQANTMRLLEEQIQQNFNYPSILFWSLGNEIYWLPDFEGGGDTKKMNTFLKKLHEKAHQLDPSRMTAIRKYYDGSDLVDVFSPSIWSGWYGGVYKNYANALEESRKKYPRFMHMEYGGSSHVGRHTEKPVADLKDLRASDWTEAINQVNIKNIAQGGDWSESYIVDLFDWHLMTSESTDWFAGNAQWAFKDFGTPLRPENAIPYVNQKGLVDRAGKPKDAFYVFQSYWSKEPMVYIESHTWTERIGEVGETKMMDVYSNCPEVELFLNGVSQGTKKRDQTAFPACGLRWPVQLEKGENTLIAIGKTAKGKIARDTISVKYLVEPYGKPHEIVLSTEPLPNGNLLIVATMQDKKHQRVLNYEKPVYFSHDGGGHLLENYGTPTRSRVIEFANGRASVEYAPGESKAVIEARNQDFKGSYLIIDHSAYEE